MHITKTLLLIAASLASLAAEAKVSFSDHFEDRTLRLDYIFAGNNRTAQVFLSDMAQSPGWYGRRVNLDRLHLLGNGQIYVTHPETRDTLYAQSFSTLFQEWQTTEQAASECRAMENVFLVPFPKHPVDITLQLTDTHRRVSVATMYRVDPTDILIQRIGEPATTPWSYLRKAGDSREKIDLAFVAEGYTEDEMNIFHADCRRAMEAILSHEPFRSMADRFNFVAVAAPSRQSGISIPGKHQWVDTALGSHFDTFYSARYLTSLRLKRLHDVLAGIPYEHLILLANTDNYGGGGIYNSYTLSSAHHATMEPVVVHEVGHSYGGLGDEYYYDDQYEVLYPADTEPWEPNITTLVDFSSKWADMLTPRQLRHIPTKPDGKDVYRQLGVYEGGGYQSKGVYRPVQECRMKINEAPAFCPVCERALRRITDYQTVELDRE